MTKVMLAIAIMQEMGWTYEEYERTPAFIISLIVEKLKRDKKNQERASKKQHRGN